MDDSLLPPVTVVIPTYNRAHLVVRALESALACVREGDEILVVDDGSTDDTAAVLAPFAQRIRFLPGPHAGAGATRNRGMGAARHDLIAFLDSDDEWDADKLVLQLRLLAACADLGFVFSDFRVVDDATGRRAPRYLRNWMRDPRPWSEIAGAPRRLGALVGPVAGRDDCGVYVTDWYPVLLQTFCIPTFTLAFRKSACAVLPQFAQDVPIYEDHQFFAQLARSARGAYLDCETATNHGHAAPRLTHTDALRSCDTLLLLTRRIWGQDEAFLRAHRQQYEDFERELCERRVRLQVRDLLLAGDLAAARAAACGAPPLPWKLRLILTMPAWVHRLALAWQRRRQAHASAQAAWR